MKVAVCYSGLVRTLPKVYDNHFENIYQHYDCDLYFHFWDSWGHGNVTNNYTYDKDDYLTEEEKNLLVEKFKPKSYIFENFKDKEKIFEGLINYDNQEYPYCKNVLSMHYKIMKCNTLVINSNVNYDVVLRLRPDHMFTKKITFKNIVDNTIFTSMIPTRTNGSEGVNDQIAYGNTSSMVKYSNFFDMWKNIYVNETFCNPEHIFKKYLTKISLNIEDDTNLDHWIMDKNNNLR